MLKPLYLELADALNGELDIERTAANALREAAQSDIQTKQGKSLPQDFLTIFAEADAHPVCQKIAQAPFDWRPPGTSQDPKYLADSRTKVHVELLGPDGLVKSNSHRIGLYGMPAGHKYGLRTHLAEEVFVMLAGECDWRKGEEEFQPLRAPQRSYHPSMMPHANRSRDHAFMTIYVWRGDVSNDSYNYRGVSDKDHEL